MLLKPYKIYGIKKKNYIRKEERSQLTVLSFHTVKPKKEELIMPNVSKREEIIKIMADFSNTENRKQGVNQ